MLANSKRQNEPLLPGLEDALGLLYSPAFASSRSYRIDAWTDIPDRSTVSEVTTRGITITWPKQLHEHKPDVCRAVRVRLQEATVMGASRTLPLGVPSGRPVMILGYGYAAYEGKHDGYIAGAVGWDGTIYLMLAASILPTEVLVPALEHELGHIHRTIPDVHPVAP